MRRALGSAYLREWYDEDNHGHKRANTSNGGTGCGCLEAKSEESKYLEIVSIVEEREREG